VLLDNAATVDQVRPLLPDAAGCLTLITSRRSLTDLKPATQLTVDAFTPDEALTFLTGAVPGVPVGPDPDAAARIARRCGYLPLALSLITGHIRGAAGWTLTDHADRLDERHRDRRLDGDVEVALALSYQGLPGQQQRLLRLAALHPGQDFDAYAAAALAGIDLPTARAGLDHLRADHLLQPAGPDRYTLHDLVRAYAAGRAHDEDRPSDRRAALTRLFDHYLANSAAAMNTLHPAEADRRPHVSPPDNPAPDLTDPGAARDWLDTERPTLVAVVAHTAAYGWPGHTTGLARTLYRYLNGGYHSDALTVHGHAHQAARDSSDPIEQAWALTNLGNTHVELGRSGWGADYFRQALVLFRRAGDPIGQARALFSLGIGAERAGRYEAAIDYKRQAVTLYRQAGDVAGEGNTLRGLGLALRLAGRLAEAIDYYEQSLTLARRIGDRRSEASTLNYLGEAETESGRYEPAHDHLHQALALHRQGGNHVGEGSALDNLGLLHTRLGRPDRAIEYHRQALDILREIGDEYFNTWVLNGLGEAALAAGRPADALTHHAEACAIATDNGARDQQARARAGLGHAHRALGEPALAREHYQHALILYTELGVPEADQIRARLAELDPDRGIRNAG